MNPYALDVEVPFLPRLNSADARHWRTMRKERDEAILLLQAYLAGRTPDRPLERAHVRLTRYSSGPEPDLDNLWHSWKHVLDALVTLGVIVDDKPSVLVGAKARWVKCPEKEQRIRIELEGVVDPGPAPRGEPLHAEDCDYRRTMGRELCDCGTLL